MSESKKYMSFGSDHLFPHQQLCFFADSEQECATLLSEAFNQPTGKYAFVYEEFLENNGPIIGYVFSKNNRTQRIQSFIRENVKKGDALSINNIEGRNFDTQGEFITFDGEGVYVEDNRTGTITRVAYEYIQAIA